MLEGSGGGATSKIFLFCAIMQLAGSNKKQRPWFECGNSMQLHSSDTCIYNHLLADIYIFLGGVIMIIPGADEGLYVKSCVMHPIFVMGGLIQNCSLGHTLNR